MNLRQFGSIALLLTLMLCSTSRAVPPANNGLTLRVRDLLFMPTSSVKGFAVYMAIALAGMTMASIHQEECRTFGPLVEGAQPKAGYFCGSIALATVLACSHLLVASLFDMGEDRNLQRLVREDRDDVLPAA